MNTKRRRYESFLEVGVWLLFFALLVPAGVVGYVLGKEDEPEVRIVSNDEASIATR